MNAQNSESAFNLAARLLDTMMSLESRIPVVRLEGERVQLTLNQVRTLHLSKNKPGLHQKDVARILAVTPASVSIFVRKLNNYGLIESRPFEKDKRAVGLYLTEFGEEVFGKIWTEQINSFTDFLSIIPLETQELMTSALEMAVKEFQDNI